MIRKIKSGCSVRKADREAGFTLVEMIVVLVILAVLAAIMVPSMIGWIDKAREKQILLEARNAYQAAQTAVLECYASGAERSPEEITLEDIREAASEIAGEAEAISELTVNEQGVIADFSYVSGGYQAHYSSDVSDGERSSASAGWTITAE